MANRQERRRQKKLGRAEDKPSPRMRARLTAGIDAFRDGRFADAEAAFKDVLEVRPKEVDALHLLGLIEYQTGRLDDAADHLVAASMVDGADPAIHGNLAAVLNLCGRGAEAEAASRHVLDLQPGNAEAYNNLAVALELQGRIEDAEIAARSAIEIDGRYFEGRINLGNLLFRKGDLMAAAEQCRAAEDIDPTNPMPAGNLGVVLRRMGDLRGAEDACRRAVRLKPDYAEGFNALANVLIAQGDLPGGMEAFRHALSIRDDYLEARANLAAALYKSGALEDAEAAYEETVQRYDAFAGAWSGLGMVRLARGDLKKAEEAFRWAVKHHETLGDAWVNLAAAGAVTAEDEQRLKDLIAGAPENDQIAQMHFAAGAAADKRGDADAAIKSFTTGNAMRRKLLTGVGQGFDRTRFDGFADRIVTALDRGALEKLSSHGTDDARPVFVVGMPRSGTTLVEQIVASHPEGAGAGELDAFTRMMSDYPEGVAGLEADRARDLAGGFLKRLGAAHGDAARVVDKTPFNLFYLGLVQVLLPGARVVHCVRDADDTALSCYFTNFAQGHAWSTSIDDIRTVQSAQTRVMDHWKSVLSLPVLEVRYEDFVKDQGTASRALIDFLGLEWSDACLDFHQSGGAVLTASNWQVRKPIYKGSVGRAAAYGELLGGRA
ncbi:MAG: sulfotransferase [Rhodospirillaceae bacterium]